MVEIRLTPDEVKKTKRRLVKAFLGLRSSHVSEALAAALGHRTHASLLTGLDGSMCSFDDVAFTARIRQLDEDVDDLIPTYAELMAEFVRTR